MTRNASLKLLVGFFVGLLLLGSVVESASACSPVPYLFQLMSAGTPFGAAFLNDTIGLLAPGLPSRGQAAVRVPEKDHPVRNLPWLLHPLALTLYLTVLLKAFFIRRWLATGKTYAGLVLPVGLANALSTLPVVAFGLLYAVPMLLIPGIFLAIVMMRCPAAMLATGWWDGRKNAATVLQLLLGISFLINIILLSLAQSELLAGGSLLLYWFYKVLFCTYTVATGLFVTSAMEGWLLKYFLRPTEAGEGEFIRNLVRCNAMALATLFALAALLVLPLRFASPDWLI